MAEAAPQGLPDGFAGPNEVPGVQQVEAKLSLLNQEVERAQKNYEEGNLSLVEFTRVIAECSRNLRQLALDNRDNSEAVRRALDAFDKVNKTARDAQKDQEKLGKTVGETIGAIQSMGAILSSGSGGELLKSTLSGVGALGTKMSSMAQGEVGAFASALKVAGPALSVFSVSAMAVVAALDAAADSQKSATDVFLQQGIRAKDNADAIRQGTDAVLKAGTQFNLSEKEAGGLALALSKAGVLIDRSNAGLSSASQVTATYEREVGTLAAAHKAFGADLSALAQTGTQLGTRFSRTGEEFDEAFAKVIRSGRASGQQMDYFLKNFNDLSNGSRSLGTSFEQVLFAAGRYGDELRRGTLSIQDVIALTDTQSQSIEKQAAIFALLGQVAPEAAAKLKMTGDAAANIFRAVEIRKSGSAEEKAALSDLPRTISESLAKGGGGSRDTQMLVFSQVLSTLGPSIKNMDGIVDLFGNSVVKHQASADEQKAASMSAKSVAEQMREDAAANAKLYDGASKQFNDSVREFHTATNQISDTIKQHGMLGALRQAVAGATGAGEENYISQDQAKRMGRIMGSRASGGVIPEEGAYYLHAGERVSRGGQGGGGASVSLGGISIQVGERGSLRAEVGAAMDKLKDEVLQKVDEQWRAASLAQ
jgi:hypothetical protein